MQSFYFPSALLPEGWRDHVLVTVEDGRIATVTPEVGAGTTGSAARMTGVALPGLVNLHSHSIQRGVAGLTERHGSGGDGVSTWRVAMDRFLSQLTPDDVEAIAAQAYLEMLQGGFTACAEFHSLHHGPDGAPYDDPGEVAGRIVAAAANTGIGLTLLPVYQGRNGLYDGTPGPGWSRSESDLDRFEALLARAGDLLSALPDGVLGLAPRSLRSVSGDELKTLLAAHPEGPVHIRAALLEREVEASVAATGLRPVAWLLAHAGLDERWCVVHATQMSADEAAGLARSGAVAGLCPVTEGNRGAGLFPGAAYLAAGGRFGFGTDANVATAATIEMRAFDYGQRLACRARNALSVPGMSNGRRLFEGALRGGAQAARRDSGAIAPGRLADIVVLDCDDPALLGRRGDALLDSWIYASARPAISDVLVAGRLVVREGRHIERHRITARFSAVMARLAAAA